MSDFLSFKIRVAALAAVSMLASASYLAQGKTTQMDTVRITMAESASPGISLPGESLSVETSRSVGADDAATDIAEGLPAGEGPSGTSGEGGSVSGGQAAGPVVHNARPVTPRVARGSRKATRAPSPRLANGYIPSRGRSTAGAIKSANGGLVKTRRVSRARSNGYIPSGGSRRLGAGIVTAGGRHIAFVSASSGRIDGHREGKL